MEKNCLNCGIGFVSKKESAKFCSPKCRVTHSRRVTLNGENVTLSDPLVTQDLWFEFYTIGKARDPLKGQEKETDVKSGTRKAKYWYDVPLAAIPVIKKGFPEMPDYMNGRQYFLWWKNEFKYSNKNPESPEIHNPYPERDNVVYVNAGEGSRRWGA